MINVFSPRADRVRGGLRLATVACWALAGLLAGNGTSYAAEPEPEELPGGTYCEFDVLQTTLVDKTKTIVNESGIRSTGHYVVQFMNPDNGKSVTYNVSGASQFSVGDNRILTATFTGPSFVAMGPGGQANTGLSGIVYTPGRTVVTVDLKTEPDPTVLTFKSTTTVTDVCALLA